jgi:hypothetical protein
MHALGIAVEDWSNGEDFTRLHSADHSDPARVRPSLTRSYGYLVERCETQNDAKLWQKGGADWVCPPFPVGVRAGGNDCDFGFDTSTSLTAERNKLFFWFHQDVGIPISPGVDEIALALVADVWSRTNRSRLSPCTICDSPLARSAA